MVLVSVHFPNQRDPTNTTYVSKRRFEADCVARWNTHPATTGVLVTALADWLYRVLKDNNSSSNVQSPKGNLTDHLLHPPLLSDLVPSSYLEDVDRSALQTCATEIARLLVTATLREMPFWGMSRVRRANALFERHHRRPAGPSPMGPQGKVRVRATRRVTFKL